MRILGIDPALRITGYGVIESDRGSTRLLETGVIKPKVNDLIQNRINKIYMLEILRETGIHRTAGW